MKIWIVVVMMIVMGNMAKSELERHYVGGNKGSGWGPHVNLTEWSSHQHFHVNDWLYFGYENFKYLYNVLEVNKTSYEKCIDTGFIMNYTKGGGKDVVHLKEAKTYYFLSGGGFCWSGLKVAVDVTEVVAPAPQPVAPKSGSASVACGIVNQTLLVLILVFMWCISLNNI